MGSPARPPAGGFTLRRFLIPLALVGSLMGTASLAEEDDEGSAVCDIIAFTMSDGTVASRELETALGKIRGSYEESPMLFLTVNLATVGGRHQGEMLFHALGLNPVWDECRKAPAQLVLVNLEPAEVLAKLSAKDDLAKALDAEIAGDEGCGCGD